MTIEKMGQDVYKRIKEINKFKNFLAETEVDLNSYLIESALVLIYFETVNPFLN
jgi:hypothetical protein